MIRPFLHILVHIKAINPNGNTLMLLLHSGGSWQPCLPQEITLSTAVEGRRLAVQSTLHPTAWAALQPFGSDLQCRSSTNDCTDLSLPLL